MQRNHNFNYHAKCEKLGLTNVCFVDDLLIFSRGDKGSVEIMMNAFGKFFKSIELKVIPAKCCIYFGGVDQRIKENIKHVTAFKEGVLPFRYLEVSMTSKKLTIHNYMSLIDMIVGRITHWSYRLLSYVSMVQLLKSVTFTIMNYWMQCL